MGSVNGEKEKEREREGVNMLTFKKRKDSLPVL